MPLYGSRDLVLASWRLVETLGRPGAEHYVASRLRCAEEADASCEIAVWRMVAHAVRQLTPADRAGVTLH
jgi:hypothetical protein